mmetsp:Transcript_2651/g.4440  ORF Transcript_2651/g.4440 Transcript_2651/m.4440 type:complete len:175 (-) Transcript_2651:1474-1998(-)
MRIQYIGGIVSSENLTQFKRLVIRSTRCQVYVHTFEVSLASHDKLVGDNYDSRKHIFVLAFQDGSILEDKIRRVCNSFSTDCFDVRLENIVEDIQTAEMQKLRNKDIIRQTKNVFLEYLETVNKRAEAPVSVFKVYKVYIMRERAIYTHLNMLKQTNLILQGLVWCPKSLKFEQ